LIGIPIFVGTYFINPQVNVFKNLGLSHQLLAPIILAFLFTLPMLLGGFIFYDISSNISMQNILAGSIVIGFIEELFFRGFLFGQLFRHTRLGFIPSIIFGALLFASGHLYQSQDMNELIGIFAVTFMGAILFAWLYVEWEYNLWVPIFLHALMNLYWDIFEMNDTALGGLIPNVIRAMTIGIAIGITILYKINRNQTFMVTKDTLLKKTLVKTE
jgi:membrane protease YdiL (CAAX protease family)